MDFEFEGDEMEERLGNNARDLIEHLREANDNAPWSDPHAILVTAVEILEREHKMAEEAEVEAEKADSALAEKKK